MCRVVGVVDELGLERREVALGDGVVPAVALVAHAGDDAELRERAPVLVARIGLPRSEWWTRPRGGFVRELAIAGAASTSLVSLLSLVAQPTTRRA